MTSMALWHLELLPGQKYPVMVTRDFRITNAALGEEIVDESGRSVVKITHQPVNPRDLADDSDSDSDSDFSDDEDEEDEDEEVDMEKLMAAMNGKKGKKASAEEEEEDEDEDDEDFEEDPVATAVVCSLLPGKIEQTQLDLTFVSEEVVMFEVTGKNPVHLMGNYIHQETGDHHHHGEDYEESDDEDFSFEEDSDDEDMSMGEDASHRFEEVKEDAKAKKADATKKRKAETQETDSKRSTASATEKKAPTPVAAEKKAEQPAKKQKTDAAKPVEKKKDAAEKPEQKSSKKQTLPSGLIIEDAKIGDGPVAKKGKRVGMRYIGKLMNGKVFDSNTSGQPFYFRLGGGEVIKGWDQGVEGMAVGGERKLTIPAKLAYGSQKLPGIPANSILQFELKVVNVK